MKFAPGPTLQDDVALIGVISGSTDAPKATMHFHRDLLIIADGRNISGDAFSGNAEAISTLRRAMMS